MEKLRLYLQGALLIGLFILAVPFFVIMLAGGLLLYVTINAMCDVVCDIWEDDLTEAWNELIISIAECIDDIKELFLMEMELD